MTSPRTLRNFIGGTYVDARGTASTDVVDPAGQQVAHTEVPVAIATNTVQIIATFDAAGKYPSTVMFHDQRTLAASGTEDLDLAGALTNPLTGAAMTFVELRAVMITAASTNPVMIARLARRSPYTSASTSPRM